MKIKLNGDSPPPVGSTIQLVDELGFVRDISNVELSSSGDFGIVEFDVTPEVGWELRLV